MSSRTAGGSDCGGGAAGLEAAGSVALAAGPPFRDGATASVAAEAGGMAGFTGTEAILATGFSALAPATALFALTSMVESVFGDAALAASAAGPGAGCASVLGMMLAILSFSTST